MAASTWSTGLEPRAVRMSLYIVAACTLAAALALLAASGATFGPMGGDIPWPATAAEQAQFDAARALQWTGLGLVVDVCSWSCRARRLLCRVRRYRRPAQLTLAKKRCPTPPTALSQPAPRLSLFVATVECHRGASYGVIVLA